MATINPHVRSGVLTGFIKHITSLGLDAESLLKDCGIKLSSLDNPEERISFISVLSAYEKAAVVTENPIFGLEVGFHSDLSRIGKLGFAVSHSADLRSAIEVMASYLRLHNEGVSITLANIGENILYRFDVIPKVEFSFNQYTDASLGWILKIVNSLAGFRVKPIQVYIAHKLPLKAKKYSELLMGDVEFDADFNGMKFSRDALNRKCLLSDPELCEYIKDTLDTALVLESLVERVSGLLRLYMPSRKCGILFIADQLGMDKRTLQRHLKLENKTFKEIHDKIRAAQAERYLASSNISLTDISHLLGYSDQSAFTHAFYRWFNKTPVQFKRDI